MAELSYTFNISVSLDLIPKLLYSEKNGTDFMTMSFRTVRTNHDQHKIFQEPAFIINRDLARLMQRSLLYSTLSLQVPVLTRALDSTRASDSTMDVSVDRRDLRLVESAE